MRYIYNWKWTKRWMITLSFVICHLSFSVAQTTNGDDTNDTNDTTGDEITIKIGGNVYGGGNKGEVKGNTNVSVYAGNIGARTADASTTGTGSTTTDPIAESPSGKVFGGARMANVGGSAYVHIDGAHASSDMVINQVYGGNDISGVIGSNPKATKRLPAELTDASAKEVDNTWNSFVRVSSKMNAAVHYTQEEIDNAQAGDPAYGKTTDDIKTPATLAEGNKKIFIGKLFGGGNGDYFYSSSPAANNKVTHKIFFKEGDTDPIATKVTDEGEAGFNIPELAKSFIDIHGGTIADAYGGGNNATVTEKAVICVDNLSNTVTQITSNGEDLLKEVRFREMGVWNGLSHLESDEFQIGSLFGGNNKATMDIRPTWNLQEGAVRYLYSGGNKGAMIYEHGLFLEIPETSKIVVDNLFGGCRMADVHPMKKNGTTYEEIDKVINDINDYNFPPNLAARVIIKGGDVNNVYGGNDVRGKVYFGNAVGILHDVRGNVYGGGNGAYAYTDNEELKDKEGFSDYYYDHTGKSAVAGLLDVRPNAEQVSILVRGKDEDHPTIIGGSVYVGGNCATLKSEDRNLPNYPLTELKIGSHSIIDKVFLGNNGEGMVTFNAVEKDESGKVTKDEGVLHVYKSTDKTSDGSQYNTMDLTDPAQMAIYMSGVSMSQRPRLTIEDSKKGDHYDYEPYSSHIGSLYYGGNRGSMTYSGPIEIKPEAPVYIYDRLVAGCNNANIAKTSYNARFEGGILGSADEQAEGGYLEDGKIRDRVLITLSKLRFQPQRLNKTTTPYTLEWNTIKNFKDAEGNHQPVAFDNDTWCSTGEEGETAADIAQNSYVNRRLLGGNLYGGCYESGHVNGNVVINLNGSLHNRHEIFAAFEGEEDGDDILYEPPSGGYNITKRNSGVILNEQGMDVLGEALTVFGGGKGAGTQIWGSSTINITKGYTFQVFGGSESGAIGKADWTEGTLNPATEAYEGGYYNYPTVGNADYEEKYSTYITLNDPDNGEGVPRGSNSPADLADVEFIYGGGFEGPVLGSTHVNLDNGRLFNLFAGSCNADILGHTETYVGLNGFPYLRDHIYGGNDLGGEIKGTKDYTDRVSDEALPMVHPTDADGDGIKDVLQANAYVEYRQGNMKTIFGGCFGDYDYEGEFPAPNYSSPKLNNAFINFRPLDNAQNHADMVFGAGEGYPGYRKGDEMQNRSYVLIDIADEKGYFANTEVFGGGSNNGLGMGFEAAATLADGFNLDKASAIIDLARGQISAAYGGSYHEGITRRTLVNVPEQSSVIINNIFGGAYGTQILPPCDVYESNVNYRTHNDKARVTGAIYGGNNSERRTLFTKVNISAPVITNDKGYTGTVYGAGRGVDTWSEYTEVNLEPGARVYNVYGGGEMGHVLNSASVQAYITLYKDGPSDQISKDDPFWKDSSKWTLTDGKRIPNTAELKARWASDWNDAWAIGSYYIPDADGDGEWTDYAHNSLTNLDQVSPRAELDDKTAAQLDGKTKHNTNVIINEGAIVEGYAYGGGLGDASVKLSGDVYGSTYVAVLGGEVQKDVYAGGRAGGLDNLFGAEVFDIEGNKFTATANAYIQGGTARNVYGGGYEGHVGHHEGSITTGTTGDRPAESYVVIGKTGADTFTGGAPAITRNVYGGGEGGSVYGTSNVTLNNGMIGYRYKNTGTESAPAYSYVPELDDQKPGDLDLSGNIFGGGYVVNSYVDIANVTLYGGTVRGSVYGGGEIGPIGRGTMKTGTYSAGLQNGDARIFKAGETHIRMFNGHVLRNVFGGGRGKDSWGGDGTMYMKPEVLATVDLGCKGYVFGQTDVNIYGGEVGTVEDMTTLKQYGNVFGGGDEGSVYSAYELDGTLYIGKKPAGSQRYDKGDEGYYYKYNGTAFIDDSGNAIATGAEKHLTEDCHVLVEPWLQVKNTSINYGGKTYDAGDYIPTSYLNTLGKKDKDSGVWASGWDNLDTGSRVGDKFVERGVIIHNAVFAGGNIGIGSEMFANTNTVFGNATATIHDAYNRDLITIGTGYTGGLYGDGNLTFVDGYRELNITNYGTDYFNIKEEIGSSEYDELPPREQNYYEIKYKCQKECTDNEGTTYKPGSTLPKDELLVLFENQSAIIGDDSEPKAEYWIQNGVVSRYAGRIMNTIQRADFCGVFGSRMVMKGARDRVVDLEDKTNYTINRVREVSLNKKASGISGDTGDYATHGNYFGIYNVVNYLGALTSDVDFYGDVRYTDNKDTGKYKTDANGKAYGVASFSDWKIEYSRDPRRNNGKSHNQVALASGVYLELTTEESTGKTLTEKVWGPITGVVELDLINISNGLGGGYVYAKNIHGVREATGKRQTLLTEMNLSGGINGARAATNKSWKYIETEETTATNSQEYWETSGNFVHNTQVIIDDCHDENNRYLMSDAKRVPAHKWYIRGTVYVYDRYITAVTGNPNAYSETVALPITVSAASHNKMKLLDVQPNLYAYYSSYNASTKTPLSGEQKLVINDVTYELNTPISYWDWYLLPKAEQNLFVKDTYVTTAPCVVGSGADKESHPEGYVMLPDDYDRLWDKAVMVDLTPDDGIDDPEKVVQKVVIDEEGNEVAVTDVDGVTPVYVPFNSVFHSSNDVSHTSGYILTHELTNPGIWNDWYTKVSSATHEKQQASGTGYEDGPTYHLRADKLGETQSGKLLGQREYKISRIIPQKIYNEYSQLPTGAIPDTGQAEFEAAYVVLNECSTSDRRYYPGAAVSATEAGNLNSNDVKPAYVCIGSIQLSPTKYIFINELMTKQELDDLKTEYSDMATELDKLVVPAYYCTKEGLYGGTYFEKDVNYRALETFSSLSEEERENFEFNYDALDLLIDPTYGQTQGMKYQYDSKAADLAGANANAAHYSLSTPLDYTATFDGTNGTSMVVQGGSVKVTHANGTEETVSTIVEGDVLEDDVFESLINEQYHYAPIDVEDVVDENNEPKKYYVVNTDFFYNEPFAVGQVIDEKTYEALPHLTGEGQLNLWPNVTEFTFTARGTYYYCRDPYTIAAGGTSVKEVGTDGELTTNMKSAGQEVPLGFLISQDGDGQNNSYQYGYRSLINQQTGFTIHGVTPTETITFFVNRESNYDDLTKEKIITVVYQYDYEESDESGMHITPITERHVVRIHITFENGVPVIEDILEPDLVLPGTSITMAVPGIDSDEEIISGGWELYANKTDAESHIKFKDYTPSNEPLYWYQDGFYIAYYAQSFNKKTYSNHVPVHVANYHDLKEVMDDKENHLFVDYDRTRLQRDSKIYINDYSESQQDGLDLLKDFYDLSLMTTAPAEGSRLEGHSLLNNSTNSGTNIYDGSTYVKGVRAGKNLEFILRTDIERGTEEVSNPEHESNPDAPETITQTIPWTPIGLTDCFAGTLHGDGHHISGLKPDLSATTDAGKTGSLFSTLCGEVYNLGVSGTFTGAGIADAGSGYVESCWVSSSADQAKTSAPVFGTPSRTAEDIAVRGAIQMVNCYYEEDDDATNKYPEHTAGSSYGVPTRMPSTAFYNGTVAYNLNNFYLYRRYCDKQVLTGDPTQEYRYLTFGEDDTPVLSDKKYYANDPTLCSSGTNGLRYVEERFADGDFRFANHTTTTESERYYVEKEINPATQEETVKSTGWYPIWPDDYLFFGQALNYNHVEGLTHQEVPEAINRDDNGRVLTDISGNRVYRAPAYFRNYDMKVAHFNPYAVFAAHEKLTNEQVAAHVTAREAYLDMTAIDFTGHNDVTHAYKKGWSEWSKTSKPSDENTTDKYAFFPPLLDDDGLTSFRNVDLTKNLLVYTEEPGTSAAGKTGSVVSSYLLEPEYAESTEGYRCVAFQSPASIHGHWAVKQDDDYIATRHHLLVDKEDFNAPMSYKFDSDHLMWYQRTPDENEFVDRTKGWQAISLPFTAELVTTQKKGEITHFYSGSEKSKNDTNSKLGHEYWLRELYGNEMTMKSGSTSVLEAVLSYPFSKNDDADKTVTNSFLWDYFYNAPAGHNHLDYNEDEYQTYYKPDRSGVVNKFEQYAPLTKAKPYILGLPGATYYEFDLSGTFDPTTTAVPTPDPTGKQTITFASNKGERIGVSTDDEKNGVMQAYNRQAYTFYPSYLNHSFEAGTESTYTLAADGGSFDLVPAKSTEDDVPDPDPVKVPAFRPYFVGSTLSGARETRAIEQIVFGHHDGSFGVDEESQDNGYLKSYARDGKIVVESGLRRNTEIRIVNVAGQPLAEFTIEPGQTVETRIINAAVYIVQTTDGQYRKKLSVK